MRYTYLLPWICFALVAFGGATALSSMAPDFLASHDPMALLAGAFFVVMGSFKFFRAKEEADEWVLRTYGKHSSDVSSRRILGAIGIVAGAYLLGLTLTQPPVP